MAMAMGATSGGLEVCLVGVFAGIDLEDCYVRWVGFIEDGLEHQYARLLLDGCFGEIGRASCRERV